MKIFYHPQFNIDFGIFNRIHPFDGVKFRRVYEQIKDLPGIQIVQPQQPMALATISQYVGSLLQPRLTNKSYILQALELPDLPFIPFSFVDRKILLPMRWGAAATLEAASLALKGEYCWNLAGGYHHASPTRCEGFCIYNDILTSVKELRANGRLAQDARVLIIDVDAHHGNGNAASFYDDPSVVIVDQYNRNIYPQNKFYVSRLNLDLPVRMETQGPAYLQILRDGLDALSALVAKDGGFALAFVVAGTDVLAQDRLGMLGLSIEECIERDCLLMARLRELGIAAVFLGGGGYSKDSALAISGSIRRLYC